MANSSGVVGMGSAPMTVWSERRRDVSGLRGRRGSCAVRWAIPGRQYVHALVSFNAFDARAGCWGGPHRPRPRGRARCCGRRQHSTVCVPKSIVCNFAEFCHTPRKRFRFNACIRIDFGDATRVPGCWRPANTAGLASRSERCPPQHPARPFEALERPRHWKPYLASRDRPSHRA